MCTLSLFSERTAKAISRGWFLIRNSDLGVFLPLALWGVGEDSGGRDGEMARDPVEGVRPPG